MKRKRPQSARLLAPLAGLLLLVGYYAPSVEAHVDLTLDAQTISDLLAALMPEKLRVPITQEQSILVEVSDFKVTGFDPSAGSDHKGYVLTSLRLRVPELGLSLPVEPRLSLDVLEENGQSVCQVHFQEVKLAIPMVGAVDISGLLPTIRVPADHLAQAQGAKGDVHVRSRLVDVLMGSRALRLRFEVSVVAIDGTEL